MSVKPTVVYVFSVVDEPNTVAAKTFLSLFNPAGSGKVLAVPQVVLAPYSVGATSIDESVSLFRTTAASGGTLVPASEINQFDPAHPAPTGQIRVDNPSVTTAARPFGGTPPTVSAGLGNNSALTVTGGGGALVVYPGTGLAFKSEAGDIDQRWNISIFWAELP